MISTMEKSGKLIKNVEINNTWKNNAAESLGTVEPVPYTDTLNNVVAKLKIPRRLLRAPRIW